MGGKAVGGSQTWISEHSHGQGRRAGGRLGASTAARPPSTRCVPDTLRFCHTLWGRVLSPAALADSAVTGAPCHLHTHADVLFRPTRPRAGQRCPDRPLLLWGKSLNGPQDGLPSSVRRAHF